MLQIDLSAYSKNGLLTDIGYAFERYTVDLLNKNGYEAYKTQSTGDFGGDVIAEKDNVKYAIQCKYSTKDIGVKALQEAIAGREYYSCDKAVVITNCDFTKQAQEFAQKTNVLLWNENQLSKFIKNAEIPEYIEYMEKPDDDTEYDFSSNFTEADYKVKDIIERIQGYEKDIRQIYSYCLSYSENPPKLYEHIEYKSLVVQPEDYHYDEYNNYVPNQVHISNEDKRSIIIDWCSKHIQEFYSDLCELDKCLGIDDCQSNYKAWYDELSKMYDTIYTKFKYFVNKQQQKYKSLQTLGQEETKQQKDTQQTKTKAKIDKIQNEIIEETMGAALKGLRFRKRINLGGGLRLNLSKSGLGFSTGVKGFRVTKTAKGNIRTTMSIPGTGVSYVKEISPKTEVKKQVVQQSTKQPIQQSNTSVTTNIQDANSKETVSDNSTTIKQNTVQATKTKNNRVKSLFNNKLVKILLWFIITILMWYIGEWLGTNLISYFLFQCLIFLIFIGCFTGFIVVWILFLTKTITKEQRKLANTILWFSLVFCSNCISCYSPYPK